MYLVEGLIFKIAARVSDHGHGDHVHDAHVVRCWSFRRTFVLLSY